MKNGSYKIYALAICFVTLMCSAITMGVILYNFVKIAAPEVTLDSHTYDAHQSIEAFRRSSYAFRGSPIYALGRQAPAFIVGGAFDGSSRIPVVDAPDRTTESPAISDDELEKLRVQSYESVLRGHKHSAVQSTIRLTIILLVSLSLFFIHWRLIKKEQ